MYSIEFLNKFGKVEFENLKKNAFEYYSFLEFYYKNDFESSDKVEYINKMFENLSNVNSEIERELIFKKLSEKTGIEYRNRTYYSGGAGMGFIGTMY